MVVVGDVDDVVGTVGDIVVDAIGIFVVDVVVSSVDVIVVDVEVSSVGATVVNAGEGTVGVIVIDAVVGTVGVGDVDDVVVKVVGDIDVVVVKVVGEVDDGIDIVVGGEVVDKVDIFGVDDKIDVACVDAFITDITDEIDVVCFENTGDKMGDIDVWLADTVLDKTLLSSKIPTTMTLGRSSGELFVQLLLIITWPYWSAVKVQFGKTDDPFLLASSVIVTWEFCNNPSNVMSPFSLHS